MPAYYNEFSPEPAHMLRQLIKDGLIAPGDVDERSIVDVRADDLIGYEQCHFFAGIGGWSVALRLAGVPDNRPLWTGSPPCQEHSTAGRKKGAGGSRNLWPHFGRLIAESKPPTVFGEQVASAIAYGWLDEAANDMEAQGYAFAAAVLPACSVGRPHKRDRIWFVADSCLRDDGGRPRSHEGASAKERLSERDNGWKFGEPGDFGSLENTECARRQESGERKIGTTQGEYWQADHAFDAGEVGIICHDGKSRPVKSGVRLLADGIQHRTPILHGLGNAIVPQVAAEFIKATM